MTTYTAELTDDMRQFLRSPYIATMPTYDAILFFIRTFKLTPELAGRLLAQWITEVAS